MQYQPPGVGLAVLPQLLEITRFMCEKGYTDSGEMRGVNGC